jgi:hypothetical protein
MKDYDHKIMKDYEHKRKIRRWAKELKDEHGDVQTDEYWEALAKDSVDECRIDDPIIYETL